MPTNGRSVAEIAVRQPIAVPTVRVHVRKVLAKTGTTRQAQLVSLILRSAAGLGA
jgi:DNA-binding CsgD family transcriptional regulator